MKKEDHDALMKLQAQAVGKRMAERIAATLPNKNPNGLNDFLKTHGNVSDAEFYTGRDGYWEDPMAKLKGKPDGRE